MLISEKDTTSLRVTAMAMVLSLSIGTKGIDWTITG